MIVCLVLIFALAITMVISLTKMQKRTERLIAEVRLDAGRDREAWKEFIRKVGSRSYINGR